MRISTSQMFDRPTSLMAALNQQADSLQTQISTSKKISAPSDDPTAYVQLDALKRAGADDSAYASNVKLAQGLLAQSDSTLESVQTQLQRVQELAVQASNGTLNAADRAGLVTSINEIASDLVNLANTKDVRGQALFGGASGDAPYVQNDDGSVSFTDSGQPAPIPVGDGDAIATSVTGDRAFGDMFATLKSLSDTIASGGDTGAVLDSLQANLDSVTAARASVGARGARLDLTATRLSDAAAAREVTRSGLEDTDITTSVADLQKTLTILQATQASFTKLSSLSLFDYLK